MKDDDLINALCTLKQHGDDIFYGQRSRKKQRRKRMQPAPWLGKNSLIGHSQKWTVTGVSIAVVVYRALGVGVGETKRRGCLLKCRLVLYGNGLL